MSYENICYKCKRKIKDFSFKCRYCNKHFCGKHRLPEDHNCEGLEKHKKGNQERWKKEIKQEFYKPKQFSQEKKIINHKDISNKEEKSETPKIRKFHINFFFIILFSISVIAIIFFASGGMHIFSPLNCSDGTFYSECSNAQPLYCSNGTLVNNASHCRCPYDYKINGNNCEKIKHCSDGTDYSECSNTLPLYCSNGLLVENANYCGCPTGKISQGDTCISQYATNGKEITFNYVLNGQKGSINYEVYGGLNDYLASLDKSISYYEGESTPTTNDFITRDLSQEDQQELISPLVSDIQNITNNADDQVRIAVSLVQNIPYGGGSDLTSKYPYQVLYTDLGVCGEKSELLALMLKDLGYGAVIFDYPAENHETVGIKCPTQYSLGGTGYCFIETTIPSIITDSSGNYPLSGDITCIPVIGAPSTACSQKLSNDYSIITIADGNSFDSVIQEYNDAITLENLNNIGDQNNGYLSESQYYQWQAISQKYGLPTS